jgi:DNA-binding LacI/PurR family transcriptional regulator
VDVARAAGVSQTTVSFVLNNTAGQSISEQTRARVLEASRQLAYRPHASAQSLAAGRSDIVLLSLPYLPIGPSVSRLVEQFAAALAGHRLTLVTHLSGVSEATLPDFCARVSASVVVGIYPFDQDTEAALYAAGADIVLAPTPGSSDSLRATGRVQVEHLIERGHRRIGYALPITSSPENSAEELLSGAAEACAAAGLPAPVQTRLELEIPSAAAAVSVWIAESVTGVCAHADESAMAVLAGMREHALTAPDDLAVIGVGDLPTTKLMAPALSTVAFDFEHAGSQLAEAVVRRLAGEPPFPIPGVARPRLVSRSST